MAKHVKAMDGNEAAAYASYAFTEVAAIYPITPSSPMAEHVDSWSANGKTNIFNQTVRLVEMQSECGAVSAMHGALHLRWQVVHCEQRRTHSRNLQS